VEEASKISNTQIASELCLPPVKRESLKIMHFPFASTNAGVIVHCSLLAEDAVTAAIKNYRSKRAAPATDLSGTAKEIPKEAAATA
jgi:NifU-like protein involved in Fe-S cluster formation